MCTGSMKLSNRLRSGSEVTKAPVLLDSDAKPLWAATPGEKNHARESDYNIRSATTLLYNLSESTETTTEKARAAT